MASNEIELRPTSLPHAYLCDIDDSGLLREIVVMKKAEDGTIYYIDVQPLHQIDKARIKKILTSHLADKQPCWELFAQHKLSNGLNALDFFHANNVKVKRPRGALMGGGLASVGGNVSDTMVGSEFTNPAEASLDQNTKTFR